MHELENERILDFALDSPTQIRVQGTGGLCFYLPIEPVCGRPIQDTESDPLTERRPA